MSYSAPYRASLQLKNSTSSAITVAVEPWAHEFELPLGSTFALITHSASVAEPTTLVLAEGLATVWVNHGVVVEATIDGRDVWPHPKEERD